MDLFDDPFSYFAGNSPDPRPQKQIRQDLRRPLNPDEEDGALNRLLGTGLSGVAFAGSTLDKAFGGRAIRAGLKGLTGGGFDHPSELLSWLPFSDTVGLTEESNAVRGEDLAKQWGVLDGDGEKGTFELRDLVGPAVEIGLDPGTYLTFGGSALSKAGQTAKKIGALPKSMSGRIRGFSTLDDVAKTAGRPLAELAGDASRVGVDLNDLLGTPLGGLGGWKVPFSKEPPALFGTGAKGQQVADFLGNAWDKAVYSAPGRYLSAGFDPRVMGGTDETFQRVGRERWAAKTAQEAATRRRVGDVVDALTGQGVYSKDELPLIRDAFEGKHGPYPQHIGDAVDYFRQSDAEALARAQSAGVPVSEMQSVYGTRHAGRAPTPLETGQAVRRGTPREPSLSARTGPTSQREPIFDLPGGTADVNRAVTDPRIGTRARQVPDLRGNIIPDLASDNPAYPNVMGAIQQSFNAFTGDDLSRLMALRQSAVTPAEVAERVRLEKAFRSSTKGVNRAIREQWLGAGQNALAASKPFQASELRTLQAAAANGPLPPADADRLARLLELKGEADYLTRRVRRLREEGMLKQTSDPAAEILPALNTARQDRRASDILLSDYFGYDPQRHAALMQQAAAFKQQGKGAYKTWLATPEGTEFRQLAHAKKQAPNLANYLGQLDPQRQTVGLFSNDPALDAWRNWRGLDEASHRAGVTTDFVGRVAEFNRAPAYGSVPVSSLLKEVGLTDEAVNKVVGSASAKAGKPLGVKDARHLYVTPDQAAQVRGLFSPGEAPSFLRPALDFADELTNLFKINQTVPWPAFHVRNLTSSAVQSLQHGATDLLGGGRDMHLLRSGETVPGLAANVPYFAGMTDEEATKALAREMFAQKAAGHNVMGGTRDVPLLASGEPRTAADLIPGMKPDPDLFDTLTGRSLDLDNWSIKPWNVEGFGGRTRTDFIPAQAGRQVGNYVDDVTRGGMFIDLLKQGYTPAAAADATTLAHFDYAAAAPFEKNVMRRLMPFYSWSRNAIPQQLGVLARDPGGATGMAIRMSNDLRQKEGFLPPHLGGGLALPVGAEDDTGTRRYLTRIDFPWEQPFEAIRTGPGGLARTGMNVLGQLNPILKAPLELAANRQFYSGRELDDVPSPTGVSLLDELAFPFQRYLTTLAPPNEAQGFKGGLLFDDRKGPLAKAVNLLTGARLSDVDMGRQKTAALRDVVAEFLDADPTFRKFEAFSVRPEMLPYLSPDEVELMRLSATLQKRQRDLARKNVLLPR